LQLLALGQDGQGRFGGRGGNRGRAGGRDQGWGGGGWVAGGRRGWGGKGWGRGPWRCTGAAGGQEDRQGQGGDQHMTVVFVSALHLTCLTHPDQGGYRTNAVTELAWALQRQLQGRLDPGEDVLDADLIHARGGRDTFLELGRGDGLHDAMRGAVGAAACAVGRAEEPDGRRAHGRCELEERGIAAHQQVAPGDHPGKGREVDLADEVGRRRSEV